jgi:hypothetical protein
MKFKVWIEIEAIDEENDVYETASPFPVCLGEFDSLEDADKAIVDLTGQTTLK